MRPVETNLKQVGKKYRLISVETGGVLHQMGPRKLSEARATYRKEKLAGKEPEPSSIPVTSVTCDETASMAPGDELTIAVTVLPENATNKNFTAVSSDETVVTTSISSGSVLLTGASEGEATITVTTEDGGFTTTCAVAVEKPVIPVTGVTLDKSTMSIPPETIYDPEDPNYNYYITAEISPTDATNKKITWTSSEPNDISIYELDNQNIIAIETSSESGTYADVTATTEDGEYTATCRVTIADA